MTSADFTPAQWAYLEAHKDDSRVDDVLWAYSWPIPVAVITTALRVWSKKAAGSGIALDDYLIILATVRTSISDQLVSQWKQAVTGAR